MSIQKTRRIVVANLNAVGDNIVVPAVPAVLSPEGRILTPARKLRVISGYIESDAAGDLTISSGVAGGRSALSGPLTMSIAPAAGCSFSITPAVDWEFAPFETLAGEALNLFTSAAMSLDGWLVVLEVA